MLLEVQCEVSTVSDGLACHVICWCWSTVFSEVHSQHIIYQEILEHFILPSADKLYGDAGSMTMGLLCLIGQQTRLT